MQDSSDRNNRPKEDVDDLLSSIMHGRTAPNYSDIPVEEDKKPRPPVQYHSDEIIIPKKPRPAAIGQVAVIGKGNRKKGKVLKVFKAFMILLLIAGLAGAGYLYLRKPILGLLETPTPFSSEIKNKANFPLYFPTNLPDAYLLDTSSIQQPAEDRVFYVVSDDQGHTINVTLQAAIADINPVEKFDKETEPREVTTEIGKASIFITKEGLTAAILVTSKTWIFVNTNQGSIEDKDLDALLKSFQPG